jgi:hypothetical protein
MVTVNKKERTFDWLAWTPDGYFDCSPGALRSFGWHLDRGPDQLAGFAPPEQFRDKLQRPDVLRKLLATP